MKRTFWRGLIGVLLFCAQPVNASTVIWQLQNVNFQDGGNVTGWFSVDNVTHTFLDWNINVAGGNTPIFPATTYNSISSSLSAGGADPHKYEQPLWDQFYINFSLNEASFEGRPRQLRLAFATLPDVGGVVELASEHAFAGECYNCGPFRLIVSGEISAPVIASPVPGPIVGAGLPGLLMAVAGFIGWRRSCRVRALSTIVG